MIHVHVCTNSKDFHVTNKTKCIDMDFKSLDIQTVGDKQNCCGMFTDYISTRVHYSRVRSTLVPSVACQTTEGEYHSTNHLPTY